MKAHRLIIAALAFACAAPGEDTVSNAVGSAEQALGVTIGRTVTNGFVFVDGRYLEPPYVVSRRGHTVQINDVVVEQPCPWPIPEAPKVVITTEDPEVPASLTEHSSEFDPEFIRFHVAKRSYLYYHLKLRGKDYSEAMVKAYASLPNVESAKMGRDLNYIEVKYRGGGVGRIRIVPMSRKPKEWTPESLLESLETSRRNYETRLAQGDYFCVGSRMSRTTGTSAGALMTLVPLVEILKASKDAKEVQQRFQAAGWLNWGDHASEAFFTNRTRLTGLAIRLEALKQAAKEKERDAVSFK